MILETRRVDGPPANPTSLGEVWTGITKPEFLDMLPVGELPAHPPSLGEVWVGILKPHGNSDR